MKITRELLEKMKEYRGNIPITSKQWVPFTIDELLAKIGDREYDEIRVLEGIMGTELDVFRGETWLFTIIRYGGLYYVRKVNLPYEKYMAYITAARFPLAASILLAGWFWSHSFKKYGKIRGIAIILLPILIWWSSGFIPIILIDSSKFASNLYLYLLITLYLGFFAPIIFYSFKGLLLSLLIISPLIILYKIFIYPKYIPDIRENEYDFLDEKARSSEE